MLYELSAITLQYLFGATSADQDKMAGCGVGYRRWSSKFQKTEWVYLTFEQTSGIAMYNIISNLRYFWDNPLIWTDFQRSETDPDQFFRANFFSFLNFYHRNLFQNRKLFVLGKTRDCELYNGPVRASNTGDGAKTLIQRTGTFRFRVWFSIQPFSKPIWSLKLGMVPL